MRSSRKCHCLKSHLEDDVGFVCKRVMMAVSVGKMPSIQLSSFSFLSQLNKCRTEKNLSLAFRLHDTCICDRQFLIAQPSLGDQLISVLVAFGSMTRAQKIFDILSLPQQSSWDALIIGYLKQGNLHHAVSFCKRMQETTTLRPSRNSCVALLKACGVLQELAVGSNLHKDIMTWGLLDGDIFVGSALVEMYIKFGLLDKAQTAFDSLSVVDVVSWTVLIAGYVDHGLGKNAYCCYKKMQDMCISPDSLTFAWVLRACVSICSKTKGMKVHINIVKRGFERQPLVANALVDMYAKCGLFESTLAVFSNLPTKDVVSWNALIVGYAKHSYGEKALRVFDQMQCEGIPCDSVTYVQSLKACCMTKNDLKGRKIHTQVVQKGLETDVLVSNTLVNMYAKAGLLPEAQAVFHKVASPNRVLYNSLLSGYLEHNSGEKSLTFFESLQNERRPMTTITFVLGLKFCISAGVISKGQEMHTDIVKRGLEGDLLVGGTIIYMYSKSGMLAEAHGVFEKIPVQDLVSWTALMAGYLEHGHDVEVLGCYEQMQYSGIFLNAIACMCVLKACGNLGSIERGLRLHADIISKGLDSAIIVGNSLVEMYIKSGCLSTAQVVLDRLQSHDQIAYNALIIGYLEQGACERTPVCLEQIQLGNGYLNAVTLIGCLKASGITGSTSKGQWLHQEVVKKGLDGELLIQNTLIDTYSKCGLLKEAHNIFQMIPVRSVVSWTALISGYAQLGDYETVLNLLYDMIITGTAPNLVTCVSILYACSHAGLINEGCLLFKSISCELGLIPTMELFTSIVDMLGRLGHVEKAIYVLLEMPMQPNSISWQNALGACQTWGDVECGSCAFKHAVQIDESDTTAYVYMYNIYVEDARRHGRVSH